MTIHRGKGWEIHAGVDAFAFLTSYEGEPFDGVLTDAPYSSGGATRGDRMSSTITKYISTDSGRRDDLPDFEGDNRDQRSFVAWCALWLMAAWQKSKPGATLHCFTDWRQLPATSDAIQAGGWVWRGIVPWDKTTATRPQRGRHRAQCEYALFATRGPHDGYEGAPCLDGFFTVASKRDRIHLAEKPVSLIATLATTTPPGGLILDPFVGSGAHGVGALLAGRRFVGCEIVPELAELAAERLRAHEDGSTLEARQSGQGALFATVEDLEARRFDLSAIVDEVERDTDAGIE